MFGASGYERQGWRLLPSTIVTVTYILLGLKGCLYAIVLLGSSAKQLSIDRPKLKCHPESLKRSRLDLMTSCVESSANCTRYRQAQRHQVNPKARTNTRMQMTIQCRNQSFPRLCRSLKSWPNLLNGILLLIRLIKAFFQRLLRCARVLA